MDKKKLKKILILFAFGLTYGFMYILPYMKYTFYDQMIAAMKCTNEELGALMSMYAIACTLSYIPGGWIADKFKCKSILIVSSIGNGLLCFAFMFFYESYLATQVIWFLCALTGGFAFWPAMLKGIRLIGDKDEQGRMYGIFEALNGLSSLVVSFIMIGVVAVFAHNLVLGFKGAVAVMGVLCVLAGIILFFLYDENLTESEISSGGSGGKIDFKQFVTIFKMPVVWLVAFMMFGQVVYATGMSYLTPYSTGVLGLGVGVAATIGTLRTYGARFIGGPLGGVISDKTLRSASKGQVLSFTFLAVFMLLFLFVPQGTNQVLLVFMMLAIGVVFYMEKGPLYAVVPELRVPRAVSGSALAFITLIGYLPDMFAHTIFGRYLDAYGNDGYKKIFLFTLVVTVICIALSMVCVYLVKRNAQSEVNKTE